MTPTDTNRDKHTIIQSSHQKEVIITHQTKEIVGPTKETTDAILGEEPE